MRRIPDRQTYYSLLIVLLLAMVGGSTQAADYVDYLNEGKYADGQHVIYEMNVGSFTAAGTLSAAQQQLTALKRTGVDIVWLMPIFPRGGGINSPYAAKDFQQVNPAYGTVSDLRNFVAAAHDLGMQVWLDWVPNHTATDATWVTTHPEYYVQQGGQIQHPNNYSDVFQLNYSNAQLAKAMTDCLKFWIDQADIDGYRCDYISSSYIPASYWQSAIPEVKSYKAGKDITFLGEADIPRDVPRLKTVGFDYDYAWQLQNQLLDFGPNGNTATRIKAFVNTLIDNQSGINFGRMLYLTNHDQNWNESKKTLTEKYGSNRYPLTVLTFTAWGMPLIYNGQEIGGNQALSYFDDTKINWNSVDSKMQNTIRTLAALKHSVPALHDGKTTSDMHSLSWLTVTNNATGVLAYSCKAPTLSGETTDGAEILVIINFGTSAASATVTGINAGEYGLWLDSETISQGVSRKQVTLNATNVFSLEAKGYKVYVKGHYSEEALPATTSYTPTLDNSDEISIFFETPSNDSYAAWVWGDLGGGEAYCNNTSWPGDDMQLMGQSATGKYIYKYKVTKVAEVPQYLIISKDGGNSKLYDGVDFINHGYYVEGTPTPTQIITATGIHPATYTTSGRDRIFTLGGQEVTNTQRLPKGIYISNGKKIVIK